MTIKVIKNEQRPEPTPVLAEAIVRIGEAAKKLHASGLNEDAIVALLHDHSGIAKKNYPRSAVVAAHPRWVVLSRMTTALGLFIIFLVFFALDGLIVYAYKPLHERQR